MRQIMMRCMKHDGWPVSRSVTLFPPSIRIMFRWQAKVWNDPSAYYNPEDGLLTYSPSLPHSLVYPDGGMTTRGHIALIKHQLYQLKQALALAKFLKRVLILPAVVCGYDKAWYPLAGGKSRGVFPGTHAWALPIFNCPLDHFLEPGPLVQAQPIREYSFLSNPRTPNEVKSSVSAIELSKSSSLAQLQSEYKSIRVLNVTNLPNIDVLSSLLTKAQAKEFRHVLFALCNLKCFIFRSMLHWQEAAWVRWWLVVLRAG